MGDEEDPKSTARDGGYHQSSLKDTRTEGLAKSFRVAHVSSPFYSGEGKVEVSHAEDRIACLFDDNVKIISARSGEVLLSLQPDDDKKEVLTCFAQCPTSSTDIVTSSQNGLLRHWRGTFDAPSSSSPTTPASLATPWECVRAIKAHTMPILALVYDPTGTLVATGSADRTVRVWDVARGYCTHSLREHTDIVAFLRFHPNPLTMSLVSAAQDNTVRMWDLVKSQCVATFRDHMSQVRRQ